MDSSTFPCVPSSPATIVATTVVGTVSAMALWKKMMTPQRGPVIESPLEDVRMEKKPSSMGYKIDEFPGARDVATPYGSIRVYEFGPLTGKKVLFIHGITTSCLTLTKIATALTTLHNCRVFLFDLFGRGFSDTPSDLPHDSRLYMTQILLALQSSPLSWSGTDAFSIIGYSMGGALAIDFVTSFPHAVKDLVLLAPAGCIRAENFGLQSRMVFHWGILPQRVVEFLTNHQLRRPMADSVKKNPGALPNGESSPDEQKPGQIKDEARAFIESETVDGEEVPNEEEDDDAKKPGTGKYLEAQVVKYVHWMLDHHAGFIPAMVGCLREAPLTGQHAKWVRLGEIARAGGGEAGLNSLTFLMAEKDELVHLDDYVIDAKPLLLPAGAKDGEGEGESGFVWEVVGGGHNFPMTHSEEALAVIRRVWGL